MPSRPKTTSRWNSTSRNGRCSGLFSTTSEVVNGLQPRWRSDGGRHEEETGDSIPGGCGRGVRARAVFRGIRLRWLGTGRARSVCGAVCCPSAASAARGVRAAGLSRTRLCLDFGILLPGWPALGVAARLLGVAPLGRRRAGRPTLDRWPLVRRSLAAVRNRGSDPHGNWKGLPHSIFQLKNDHETGF